jgi:RND superfamily putative drug exporter
MHEFDHYLGARLPWMALAVAAIAFMVLFLATGSVVQAGIGVGLNLLVTLTTAGILFLTIQRGSLGLIAQPLDMAVVPLVFVLLFGLSMDYEVILLHRMQERIHLGDTSRHAARHAVSVTGGMITGAALIMVAVVAALLVSPFEVLQTLAIGLVSAVLLDTLVVRTLILPAIVTLLGDHAFWPVRPRLQGADDPA